MANKAKRNIEDQRTITEKLIDEVIEPDGSIGILSVNILRSWSIEKMVRLRDFLVDRTPKSSAPSEDKRAGE